MTEYEQLALFDVCSCGSKFILPGVYLDEGPIQHDKERCEQRPLDPDCRDGKHGSCLGYPCGCLCHSTDLEEVA